MVHDIYSWARFLMIPSSVELSVVIWVVPCGQFFFSTIVCTGVWRVVHPRNELQSHPTLRRTLWASNYAYIIFVCALSESTHVVLVSM